MERAALGLHKTQLLIDMKSATGEESEDFCKMIKKNSAGGLIFISLKSQSLHLVFKVTSLASLQID